MFCISFQIICLTSFLSAFVVGKITLLDKKLVVVLDSASIVCGLKFDIVAEVNEFCYHVLFDGLILCE